MATCDILQDKTLLNKFKFFFIALDNKLAM